MTINAPRTTLQSLADTAIEPLASGHSLARELATLPPRGVLLLLAVTGTSPLVTHHSSAAALPTPQAVLLLTLVLSSAAVNSTPR
jgi:hypothetical protein